MWEQELRTSNPAVRWENDCCESFNGRLQKASVAVFFQ